MKGLTVKELIDLLNDAPQDALVWIGEDGFPLGTTAKRVVVGSEAVCIEGDD